MRAEIRNILMQRYKDVIADVNTERLEKLLEEVFIHSAWKMQERCAKAALRAELPKDYQWGPDAMEQFNFGKTRAAIAITDLKVSGEKE